jgi:catechol 2,3-dioxygenase
VTRLTRAGILGAPAGSANVTSMADGPSPLDPGLRVGAVHLAVSDLSRSVAFYAHVLGLTLISEGAEEAILGAGEHRLVQLTRLASPTRAPLRSAGLFHFALLHRSRAALAETVIRIASSRWALSGASDHGVSEAIYLDDPDGLGIEIYVDRPREQWPMDRTTATIAMHTLPLDLEDLLATVDGPAGAQISTDTTVGHVHLRVADIERSVDFYRDGLGLDLQARMPSAAFLAAGGYHHHVGVNTWQSLGAPPAPPTAPGLRLFELEVSDADAMQSLAERLRRRSVRVQGDGEQIALHDPDQQALVVSRTVGSAVS